MKKIVLLFFIPFYISFAQNNFNNYSFLDKVNLFFQPQIGFFHFTHNSNLLDNKMFMQKNVKGKIIFNKGIILGVKTGFLHPKFNLSFTFKISLPELVANTYLFFNDLEKAIIVDDYYFQKYSLDFYYLISKKYGLGAKYSKITLAFNGFDAKNKIEERLLNYNNAKALFYIYGQIDHKLMNENFFAQLGVSLLGTNVNKDTGYEARFLKYNNGDNIYKNDNRLLLPIENLPHSVYFLVGVKLNFFSILPIKLLYKFQMDWVVSEYTDYKHIAFLSILIGN